MIFRNRKISLNASEIQLHMSLSKVDVLAWVRKFVSHYDAFEDEVRNEVLSEYFITEREMRKFFENDSKCLSIFPARYSEQISGWAWNICIKEGYLIASSTPGIEKTYRLAPITMKRVGRPRKSY